MARGQQKIQAQQKNAEKLAKIKKQQGVDTRAFAKAALKITCPVFIFILRVVQAEK